MNFDKLRFGYLEHGEGSRGRVSVNYENGVARKLFKRENPSLKTTGRMVRKIRNLNIHNVYKIYDIIGNNRFSLRTIHGYYMKYYKKESDLLDQPIEYVIRNIHSLEDTMQQLYKNNINVTDLHGDNLIVSKEGLIIIDVDNYSFYNPLTKRLFYKPYPVMSIIKTKVYDELLLRDTEVSAVELYKYSDFDSPSFLEEVKNFSTLYDYLEYKYNIYKNNNKEIGR